MKPKIGCRNYGTPVLLLLAMAPAARAEDVPGVRSVAFSPDGTLLAITTGEPKQQGTITLWEIATRKERWKHAETDGVPAVAFSPNGQTIAIAVYDGMVKQLDVTDGKTKATLKHPKEVRGVAFAPDGKLLATACWDHIVRIWDLASATEKVTCTGHRDRIFSVSFSPDGKLLLSAGGDDGAKLWDAATGAEKRTLKHYYMPCACFSPDGGWVITGSYDGTTRLWNAQTGEQRLRFGGTGGVNRLAFSAAARTLAVCGTGRDVSLFNLSFDKASNKDLEHIHTLLTDLDNDSYEAREATSKELVQIGFSPNPSCAAPPRRPSRSRCASGRDAFDKRSSRNHSQLCVATSMKLKRSPFRQTANCSPAAARTARCGYGTWRR